MYNYIIANYRIKNEYVKLMDNAMKNQGFSHKKTIDGETVYSNVIVKILKEFGTELNDSFMNEAAKNLRSFLENEILINNTYIEIVDIITQDMLGINYFDGSFAQGKASGCGIICEDIDSEGYYESFTEQKYKIKHKAKLIENNATNNIGELNGLKFVLEELNNKPYQLIIGDSEYSIKSFREWIYNWEKKNWKASTGKTILNLELIQEIYDMIKNPNYTFMFKWTKGHNGNELNELCDKYCSELTVGG